MRWHANLSTLFLLAATCLTIQRSKLESFLIRAWVRRGVLACALLPFSWLFAILICIRRTLYAAGWLPSTRLPVPVIIVGNIFIGGTGKTPFTIWLVQALRQAGFEPGVISRGYGSANESPQAAHINSVPSQVGDEPVLIAQRAACPVMVGRNRVDTAKALLASHPQVNVIISDDGLQHYALQRDIEIMLFDARGAGNGWLLPAGPLREPISRRRDFTILNAAQAHPDMPDEAILMQLQGVSAERLRDRSKRVPLSSLGTLVLESGEPLKIAAAAGIGNPARFFSLLRQANLNFIELALPDHFDYADNPFSSLDADIILITEKDAVKCDRLPTLKDDPRLWVVPVTARIDDGWLAQLLEKLRGRSPA